MKRIIICILLISLLFSGCVSTDEPIKVEQTEPVSYVMPFVKVSELDASLLKTHGCDVSDGIYRFEDKEKEVTCWVFYKTGMGSYGGTLSCIPNSQIVNK